MTRCRKPVVVAVASWLTAAVGGCTPADRPEAAASDRSSPGTNAPAVVLPDLATLDPQARDKVQDRYAAVQALHSADPPPSGADRARIYGGLGLMLMAANAYEPAEASFLNAVQHAPQDMRWLYYLGQLHLMREDHAAATVWFERVLELAPSDLATLVELGGAYLYLDRFDEAERLFTHATLLDRRAAAAWSGLGRVAFARREYPKAAEAFERALELDPGGTRVHYPLAMTYRSLGQFDRAAEHLEGFAGEGRRFDVRRGGRWPIQDDPLMLDYYNLLESATALEHRGNQALDGGDFAAAIDFFGRAVELDPENPLMRQRLGAALAFGGDNRGAAAQLEEALRLAPDFALAHVGLATVWAHEGRYPEAIARYELVMEYDPDYVEARLGLAQALRARGSLEAALPHYAQVVRDAPGFVEAWVGRADALVRLGRREEARTWLAEAIRAHPDQPDLRQFADAITGP